MCLLAWLNWFEVANYFLISCKDVVTVIPKKCIVLGKCFDVYVTFLDMLLYLLPTKYIKNANVTLPEVYI